MAQKTQKKENLPVKVDVDLENGGTITYANEVIATIAGVAANEIDGIAGMSVSGGFGEMLSRNKNITRGVKVEVGSQEAAVDLYIIVEYGKPIQKVSAEVQENVRKALESLTGLHVVRVDVHVQGVSFEKEKKANLNSLEASKNPVLEAPAAPAAAPDPAPRRSPKPPKSPPMKRPRTKPWPRKRILTPKPSPRKRNWTAPPKLRRRKWRQARKSPPKKTAKRSLPSARPWAAGSAPEPHPEAPRGGLKAFPRLSPG